MELPPIIQGGMGVGVSGWALAGAVSREGQFGVVSGTALAITFAQRLQRGDPDGSLRSAVSAFPVPELAQRVLERWYVRDGGERGRSAAADQPRPALPLPTWPMDRALMEVTILASFAEVYLAKKHGERGPIGINLLAKVEIATLPSLYGAMLAGVDAVFMGAGIPRTIPGILDAFAQGLPATLLLSVEGADPEPMFLDPSEVLGEAAPKLHRPLFFPIVSSDILASFLLRKSNGRIDGFVVEDHTAGGHNAPPRGKSDPGERPVWDERDRPSFGALRKLGLPFYVAGGQDDAMALRAARAQGATGIQIGTAFAFCEESGLLPELKATILEAAGRGEIEIISDPMASPTGFPFKVVQLAGTLSEAQIYSQRQRTCDHGYLRTAYRKEDGTLGWRCPAERGAAYVSKGGLEQDLTGRRCLCAGLLAAIGLGGSDEAAIITAGETLRQMARQLRPGNHTYTAREVIQRIVANTAAMDVINAYMGGR